MKKKRLLITVQDSGQQTFEKHIPKNNCSDRCRMCEEGESVIHILSGCEVLLHGQYYTERRVIEIQILVGMLGVVYKKRSNKSS